MLYDELPHRCSISRSAYVMDEMAAEYDDPEQAEDADGNEQTDVPVWIQPASKNTIIEFQRRSQRVTHTAYFRGDPGIGPGYTLTPADGPQAACPWAGQTLEVRASDETTAGLGLLWGVVCELIQPR